VPSETQYLKIPDSLESKGMLFSFDFDATGLTVIDDSQTRWSWWIFALTDGRARREIEHDAELSLDAKASLLSNDAHFQISYEDGWLHGSIPDLLHLHYEETERLGHLRFALNGEFLFTGRRQPLQTLDDIRLLVEQAKLKLPSPIDLMDRIVGDSWQDERVRLSQARRNAVLVNRQISSLGGVFRALDQTHSKVLPVEMNELFREFVQRSSALYHDIEQVQARARLLQEEIMAKLTERSNRLLEIISIMTAVLLPATIVTGMFGMNTDGLPFAGDTYGFWLVSGVAILLAALCYFVVRRLSGRP
jgi:zinc transporter